MRRHWRMEQLGQTMLRVLVRPDTPFPASGVSILMEYSLHNNINLRKVSVSRILLTGDGCVNYESIACNFPIVDCAYTGCRHKVVIFTEMYLQ